MGTPFEKAVEELRAAVRAGLAQRAGLQEHGDDLEYHECQLLEDSAEALATYDKECAEDEAFRIKLHVCAEARRTGTGGCCDRAGQEFGIKDPPCPVDCVCHE